MSQTPHFTVYEPPRFLEKEKTLDQKMDDIDVKMEILEYHDSLNTSIMAMFQRKIDALNDRIKTLEQKEISER